MRLISYRRRGYIVLLLTVSVLILCFSATQVFFNAAFVEYKTASHQANHTKAKYLAQSGFEAGLLYLNKLEKFGFFKNKNQIIPIPLAEDSIFFQAEDLGGKLNVNGLINIGNEILAVNGRQRERLNRLSEHLKISPDIWDAVIDWIDTNNIPEPYGFERTHYESLQPPRKIRNAPLHSLEELLLIPGFTNKMLFTDLRTEDEKEDIQDIFSLEENEGLVSDEDFILANNITYELPSDPSNSPAGEVVNINAAPYLVILSLHQEMTPETVKDILRKRKEKGGKLEPSDLKELGGVPPSLYEEGEGTGGVVYKSDLYKIRASATVGSQTAQITITYDKRTNDVIDYAE